VESRLTTLLNQLFLQLLLAVNEQHRDDDPALSARQHTVALFLRDLADNPDSSREPWTLPRMAAQCGMGVTSFSQHCRELVNTGAVEYLNQCRLDHAARDLRREPTRSITDLAFAHGFNSSQYFATLFRRRFRTTPRDYRMR
jgi:AraC family L-rhamnose operon regulatory protein RhaS